MAKGVAILEPEAGASVRPPFRIALHGSGMNVSNTVLSEPGSGHFRVRLKTVSGREEVMSLNNGFTEVWLQPPVGSYSERVEFIDHTNPDRVLATSPPVSLRVQN